MKKFYMLGFVSFLFLMISCLTYEKMSVRIIFDDTERLSGSIFISMIGIASSEDSLAKQQKDFDEIIEKLNGDPFLLEGVKDGIYIKHRQLTKEKDKLIFNYDGIFDNISADDFKLEIVNDELVLKTSKDDVYSNTNGIVEKDSLQTCIKWPRGTKEIYWELAFDNEKTYSLIAMYEKWLKEKE